MATKNKRPPGRPRKEPVRLVPERSSAIIISQTKNGVYHVSTLLPLGRLLPPENLTLTMEAIRLGEALQAAGLGFCPPPPPPLPPQR